MRCVTTFTRPFCQPCESPVAYVPHQLNLGWGAYRDTAGFDFGVFSANRNADGLFINWCGTYATGDSHGWQNGLVNVVSHRMCGLQIGLVNYADRLDGVQIGLLNFARSQWFFPFINIGW